MVIGRRLARASAITATAALAGIVGVSSATANPIPPKGMTTPGVMAAPAPEPAPAVPTFVNGMAQNVFSTASADWIRGEVWVESDFDTDGDGKKDRMHADYTLPKETSTDGLKVPVIYEDSPYFAGTASRTATGSSTTSSARRPPRRNLATFFAGTNTSPMISTEFNNRPGCRAASPSCTPSRPAPATPTAARRRAAATRRSARRRSSTGSTAAARRTRTRTGTVEAPAVNWHNGHTAMMGTSYNGTIPVGGRHHRRAGPGRDRPDLGDHRLVRLLPRQRHGPRAALRGRRHRQQLLPRRGPRRARRRRLLPP